MIWHLIKKEMRTKIVDFRFMITSIIGLCLIIMTTFILSEQYIKRVDQYNEFVTSDRESLNEVKVFSDLRLNAHKPPNPLWIFNKGVSNRVDQSMRIRHNWVPRQGFETESENPFLNIFQFFDLTTIFQIVLSLLAILMVYDGVCGEREEGTLTAMLSNHVARYQILFSKWLSGLISLVIPLLLSLIVSLLIMILVYGITFNGQEWMRIGIMIFNTLIFLSIFISAGLLVSSLVKRAAVSLIWLLFIWVFVVFIQPNLGSYLASSVISLPPREKEQGTLRLQCAYSLSRFKLIITKYLSSLLLMIIALLCGIIVNLIIVTIGLNASLITLHPVQILISIFLFLTYISIFLLLGLFISSQVRKSASSLALSLLVWTTFLIFIPAGGSMLGEKIHPIRSSYDYSQQINTEWEDIWMNYPVKEARGFWGGRNFPYLADRAKLVNQLDDMLNRYRADRFNELLGQVRKARNLTFLSPYALLRHAMESIAGTGLDAFVRFYEQGKIHRSVFSDYVIKKDLQDPESTHNICSWIAIAYSDKPVPLEEIPKFNAFHLSAGAAVFHARFSFFLLLCFNLLGAILAFMAFMRYDVR